MPLALGFPNRIDSSTISGQGWVSTLPISNLRTRQISQVARSQWTASKFYAAFTTATTARTLALIGHNFSTTGQFRVRGYSTDPRSLLDQSTQSSVCDLDFCESFPASSVTCTRGSTATYFDSAGVVRTASNNVARFGYDPNTLTPIGLLAECSTTNQLLWSRDWTNAAWTKTNMGTAATAGADGTASSATRLTANAANATITQARAVGSASHVSVLARRVTGSGTVQLTGDNFATAQSLTLTTSWKRFWIACSLTTATIGIKIVTSGDVVEVDFGQIELGTQVTSPIPTTSGTVTRSTDSLSITIPSNLRPSTASGSWAVHMRSMGKHSSSQVIVTANGTGGQFLRINHDASGYPTTTWGATDTYRSLYLCNPDVEHGIAYNYSSGSGDARFNATTGTSLSAQPATSAGTFDSITINPVSAAGYAIRRITFFTATQDSANLVNFSTPLSVPTAGYDSGFVNAWPAAWVSGTTAEQRSGVRGLAILDAGSEQSFQYWRIDLSDTGGPSYNQLGRVFFGSPWAPAFGMATGASIGYESRSTATEADDGAEYFTERRGPRVVRFNIEAQTQDEVMLKILEMQRQLGATREVLFQWDTADTLYQPARTFLGRLRSLSPLTAINSNLWSASFEIKELL